ncbi:MAG: hypothetical protein JO180_11040 [Gemmatirosa sp.]|nr:hypothetical protein [Gemmatirosa sp.]
MSAWMKTGLALGCGVAATAVAAMMARRRWDRATADLLLRVEGAPERAVVPVEPPATSTSSSSLDALPAPVARYFAFALTAGGTLVRRARIEQEGELATSPGAWKPFTATQHVSVSPPGFVWDARVRMMPLVAAYVRDGYVDGAGTMRGALAGVVPLVDQGGTRAMAVASLQRYLAEAPWTPPALLPSAGVRWEAIDDTTARATLVDRGVTASVDFHFGARDEIVGTTAERPRDVHGTPLLTPWVGRFGDYVRIDGMMVPREGEVAWVLPDGAQPYWRGRVTRARYE